MARDEVCNGVVGSILQTMSEEPRLLLVEDDASLASMLCELLESEGYGVEVALDGRRALHLGLSRHFDVLVLDRGLPAIEGLMSWSACDSRVFSPLRWSFRR